MSAIVENKYYLRSLHEEIDLYDRRLAHVTLHEVFTSEDAKILATNKLNHKRELLAKIARRLVSEGIEFKESELPRSFRPKDAPVKRAEAPVVQAEEASVDSPEPAAPARTDDSPFAGTSLDWKKAVSNYRRTRNKTESANTL
ncbi:MAG TPA: hypothetical protein VGC07_10345 [Granulicella sp.]